MKCPNCFSLSAPGDTTCFVCKTPLRGGGGWGGEAAIPGYTPGWAYIFAGLCVAIPICSLGGCVPILVGGGGCSLCLGLARLSVVPKFVRVLGCAVITGAAWLVFVVMMAAIFQATR